MRIAFQGSSHERRLIHEGYVLKRGLKRLLRNVAGQYRGRDRKLDILNYELGLDVVGLVAVQALIDNRIVTLVTAPGTYFDPYRPDRLAGLESLAKARVSQGRRTIVVSKHEVLGKMPFDLAQTLRSISTSDRRKSAQALVMTGRRPAMQSHGEAPAPTRSPSPFSSLGEKRPEPLLAEDDAA